MREYCKQTRRMKSGDRAGAPTGSASLLPSAIWRFVALSLSAWILLCTRTHITFDRSTGFWRRTGHTFRSTILTRKDSGGETLATCRLGSAYGAAFLSNQWYPDRLNTVRLSML